MKNFYEEATELIEEAVDFKSKINQQLCNKFNLRSDQVSRRFKSLFGDTIRNILLKKLYPSREDIVNSLITSESSKEMKLKLGLTEGSTLWKGLLDKEFGFSTFVNAKANFIVKEKVDLYNPTKDDNLSILISQILGDGSLERNYCLTIEHGEKQLGYLKFKVGLINKAFPETPGINKITKLVSKTGYISYRWRSGKTISKGYIEKITKDKIDLIPKLSPLGWMLYYMDDGCYHYDTSRGFNTSQSIISIATITLQDALIKELKTYGYSFIKYPKEIRLSDKVQVASFLSGMIKPFHNIIPTCMKYKYDMKI